MVKRIVALCLMILVFGATGVSYAAPKKGPEAKLQAELVSSVLRNQNYKNIVQLLRDVNMSPEPGNVAVEYGGQSPDGNPVYTVALGVQGEAEGTAKAVLAFVEAPEKGAAKVVDVGLVSISAEDSDGYRTMEVSGPGKKAVHRKYNPHNGAIVEGPEASEPTIGTQALDECTVTCWVAEVVACSSVCIPLGIVTGGIGGFLCELACGVTFLWTCSYCPD